MIVNSLMAFLHHLFAFGLTACLVYEFIAFRRGLSIEVTFVHSHIIE
jgi:uncharacterized membrane protein